MLLILRGVVSLARGLTGQPEVMSGRPTGRKRTKARTLAVSTGLESPQIPASELASVRNLRDNNGLSGILGFQQGKGFKFTVLMIRLARIGARKQPYYRVVVIEKDRARNGRSLEIVGLYNPRTSPATFNVKRDRIDYWVSKGAQVSDTVGRLLAKAPAADTAGTAA
jgi:small subunit ribosomal protein S16